MASGRNAGGRPRKDWVEWPEWAGPKPHQSNAKLREILERRDLSGHKRWDRVERRRRRQERLQELERDAYAREPDLAERHRAETEKVSAGSASARVSKGNGILKNKRRHCVSCGILKPIHDFSSSRGTYRLDCKACRTEALGNSTLTKTRRAIAEIDAMPLQILATSDLARALEEGAGEAIHLLRGIVARGEKVLIADQTDPRIYTTTMHCSTIAAKALVSLQVKLNEAVWRRGGGEDVLAGILKRVEEAEAREPLRHRLKP